MSGVDDNSHNADWYSDKRDAAIHEAGHVVVGIICDQLNMKAKIWRGTPADPIGDRIWRGNADAPGLARRLSAAMSVAGLAAEDLDDDSLVTAAYCVELVDQGRELSVSDRRGYPTEHAEQIKAFDVALTTLRKHREFFDWLVNQLVADDVATSDKIAEYLKTRTP